MFNLFGPSKFDRMFDLLREERATAAAQQATMLTVLAQLADSATVHADLAKQQLAIMNMPQEPPRVRLMTKDIEAEYERQRAPRRPRHEVNADDFLADFTKDIPSLLAEMRS